MKKLFLPFSIMLFFSILAMECGKDPLIEYPETGAYGDNILREGDINIQASPEQGEKIYYSLSANVPEGSSLKIVMVMSIANFGISSGTEVGWSAVLSEGGTQTFTATGGQQCDLQLSFYNSQEISINIYENGSEEPTRVKNISW